MRKILIVNDDGIESDGLLRLVRESVKYGEVWIVAPEGVVFTRDEIMRQIEFQEKFFDGELYT